MPLLLLSCRHHNACHHALPWSYLTSKWSEGQLYTPKHHEVRRQKTATQLGSLVSAKVSNACFTFSPKTHCSVIEGSNLVHREDNSLRYIRFLKFYYTEVFKHFSLGALEWNRPKHQTKPIILCSNYDVLRLRSDSPQLLGNEICCRLIIFAAALKLPQLSPLLW